MTTALQGIPGYVNELPGGLMGRLPWISNVLYDNIPGLMDLRVSDRLWDGVTSGRVYMEAMGDFLSMVAAMPAPFLQRELLTRSLGYSIPATRGTGQSERRNLFLLKAICQRICDETEIEYQEYSDVLELFVNMRFNSISTLAKSVEDDRQSGGSIGQYCKRRASQDFPFITESTLNTMREAVANVKIRDMKYNPVCTNRRITDDGDYVDVVTTDFDERRDRLMPDDQEVDVSSPFVQNILRTIIKKREFEYLRQRVIQRPELFVTFLLDTDLTLLSEGSDPDAQEVIKRVVRGFNRRKRLNRAYIQLGQRAGDLRTVVQRFRSFGTEFDDIVSIGDIRDLLTEEEQILFDVVLPDQKRLVYKSQQAVALKRLRDEVGADVTVEELIKSRADSWRERYKMQWIGQLWDEGFCEVLANSSENLRGFLDGVLQMEDKLSQEPGDKSVIVFNDVMSQIEGMVLARLKRFAGSLNKYISNEALAEEGREFALETRYLLSESSTYPGFSRAMVLAALLQERTTQNRIKRFFSGPILPVSTEVAVQGMKRFIAEISVSVDPKQLVCDEFPQILEYLLLTFACGGYEPDIVEFQVFIKNWVDSKKSGKVAAFICPGGGFGPQGQLFPYDALSVNKGPTGTVDAEDTKYLSRMIPYTNEAIKGSRALSRYGLNSEIILADWETVFRLLFIKKAQERGFWVSNTDVIDRLISHYTSSTRMSSFQLTDYLLEQTCAYYKDLLDRYGEDGLKSFISILSGTKGVPDLQAAVSLIKRLIDDIVFDGLTEFLVRKRKGFPDDISKEAQEFIKKKGIMFPDREFVRAREVSKIASGFQYELERQVLENGDYIAIINTEGEEGLKKIGPGSLPGSRVLTSQRGLYSIAVLPSLNKESLASVGKYLTSTN